MSVLVECYEDWGAATGTPARGTNRTKVTNMNLYSHQDPDLNYYVYDVQRPSVDTYTCSVQRWFTFKISGSWARIKSVKINLPKAYELDDWKIMYGLKDEYEEPITDTNEFGEMQGVLDTSLTDLTAPVILRPNLSIVGPEEAVARDMFYTDSDAVWTQYLVLQYVSYPAGYLQVANYGAGTVRVSVDELES